MRMRAINTTTPTGGECNVFLFISKKKKKHKICFRTESMNIFFCKGKQTPDLKENNLKFF